MANRVIMPGDGGGPAAAGQDDAAPEAEIANDVAPSGWDMLSKPSFQGFSLTLNAKDEAEAEHLFGALGDGGQVQMPMTETFFSPRFGMVADKFGVSWMVYVEPKK